MRDSPEVQLTLDILKHGKRFHATVSFDTDTGLKQALTKAEGRGGPIYEFFTDDLRNRRANVNIVTQVWNYALKFFHDSFILSSFSQQWDG